MATRSVGRKQSAQGWITPALHWVVTLLNWPSEQIIKKKLGSARGGGDLHTETVWNAKRVDSFVAICACMLVLLYAAAIFGCAQSRWLRPIFFVFVAWRTLDIVAVTFRMTLFKSWDYAVPAVASHARVVAIGILNFMEVWLCFAIVYELRPTWLHTTGLPLDWLTPLYFSAVTQLTIGYGDIIPVGAGRVIVMLQGGIGLLLLIVLLGRFISGLPSLKAVEDAPQRN